MSTFEFVTVLMSIVVGLGITRILSGLSGLIERRAEIKTDWLTLLWAVNVLGYHLIYWWVVVNSWHFLEEWSFSRFGPLFLYGVLLYFCAALILPNRLTAGMDLKSRFESIRKPFFMLWFLVMCSELLDSLLKGTDYIQTELGLGYYGLMTVSFALTLAALRISDRRFHFGAAAGFLLIYASWTVSAFGTI